jgi:hypothetical protein
VVFGLAGLEGWRRGVQLNLQEFQELDIYGVSTDFASASLFPFLLLFDFLSWGLGVKGEGIQ